MVEPSWVTCRPDLVHRHSLTPRLSSLYLFISRMTCANFGVSFIVRTFHVPMLMLVLDPSRLSVAHLPSWCRLSAGLVILPGWPSLLWAPCRGFDCCGFRNNNLFYGVGLLAPRPTPNLEDQVLGFVWSLLLGLPNLYQEVIWPRYSMLLCVC